MNEIRSFLIRNETQDFLTQIEKLKRDVRRESESNFDEVLTSMLSGAENEAMQTKYVMACLTAIKGTVHKPTSTTALTQLMRDSKLFGNRTSFSLKLRKDYIAVCLHYLLDSRISLQSMEELLRKYDPSAIPTPFCYDYISHSNNVSSMGQLITSASTLEEKVEALTSNSTSSVVAKKTYGQDRDCSSAALWDPSMESYKEMAKLALLSLDVFPVLQQVNLDKALFRQFVLELTQLHPALNLKLVKYFPHQVSTFLFRNMLEAVMTSDDSWTPITELITKIYSLRRELLYPTNASTSGSGKTVFGFAETEPGEASILHETDASFQQLVCEVIQSALKLPTTNSLRAAASLADLTNLPDLQRAVQEQKSSYKLRQFVIKDKWRLAAQICKNMEAKLRLYEILMQERKFLEAQAWSTEENLGRAVPQALLQEQVASEENQYLSYPSRQVPVTMVDSMETLIELANRLDISPDSVVGDDTKQLEAPHQLRQPQQQQQSRPDIQNNRTGGGKYVSMQDILSDTFRQLSLEVDMVSVVDRADSFAEAPPNTNSPKKSLEGKVVVPASSGWRYRHAVGIDIEWYAEMYQSSECASIVQLALVDHVYILDMFSLSKYRKDGLNSQVIDNQMKAVARFLRALFSDSSILKVVFSFDTNDEVVLQRVPGGFLNGISSQALHIFDLKRDFDVLAQLFSLQKNSLNSLSDFCQIFLGKPLNKSERMSDWNSRPLSARQLHYAALDAHSLLAVFDAMLLRSGLDLRYNVYRQFYSASAKSDDGSSESAAVLEEGLLPFLLSGGGNYLSQNALQHLYSQRGKSIDPGQSDFGKESSQKPKLKQKQNYSVLAKRQKYPPQEESVRYPPSQKVVSNNGYGTAPTLPIPASSGFTRGRHTNPSPRNFVHNTVPSTSSAMPSSSLRTNLQQVPIAPTLDAFPPLSFSQPFSGATTTAQGNQEQDVTRHSTHPHRQYQRQRRDSRLPHQYQQRNRQQSGPAHVRDHTNKDI